MRSTSKCILANFLISVGAVACGSDAEGGPGNDSNGGGPPLSSAGAFGGAVAGGAGNDTGSGGSGGVAVGAGGTFGTGGSTGSAGSAGSAASGGSPGGYTNLAPPMRAALSPDADTPLSPPPPADWRYYPIEGAQCRDGSPMGIYVRFGSVPKLLVYLEGGGACTTAGFCNFNPANTNMVIAGNGETVLGSALGAVPGRQQPGVYTGGMLHGIFDHTNADNPYRNWSQVYVPYCTGDVFFGSNPSAMVPGLPAPQKFVGYSNMQKVMGHLVPTFAAEVERVVLTGASAGSFGAALNASMTQDAFGSVPVDLVLDSGLPFTDQYMFTCMQKYWRELWGFDESLPPDCAGCFDPSGGGLVQLADFLIGKHPNMKLAAISSVHDEIMRLFFSMGLNDCATIETADPVAITVGQGAPDVYYPAEDYAAGVKTMLALYGQTNRLAAYGYGGLNVTLHQHTFRHRFYEPLTNGMSAAQFMTRFLEGTVEEVLPSELQ